MIKFSATFILITIINIAVWCGFFYYLLASIKHDVSLMRAACILSLTVFMGIFTDPLIMSWLISIAPSSMAFSRIIYLFSITALHIASCIAFFYSLLYSVHMPVSLFVSSMLLVVLLTIAYLTSPLFLLFKGIVSL